MLFVSSKLIVNKDILYIRRIDYLFYIMWKSGFHNYVELICCKRDDAYIHHAYEIIIDWEGMRSLLIGKGFGDLLMHKASTSISVCIMHLFKAQFKLEHSTLESQASSCLCQGPIAQGEPFKLLFGINTLRIIY